MVNKGSQVGLNPLPTSTIRNPLEVQIPNIGSNPRGPFQRGRNEHHGHQCGRGGRSTMQKNHGNFEKPGGKNGEPLCRKCRSYHTGACRYDMGACLKCGSMEHWQKDCSQNIDPARLEVPNLVNESSTEQARECGGGHVVNQSGRGRSGMHNKNKKGVDEQDRPWCRKCRSNHHGICPHTSGACHQCGSMEHWKKDCPQLTYNTISKAPNQTAKSSAQATGVYEGQHSHHLDRGERSATPGNQLKIMEEQGQPLCDNTAPKVHDQPIEPSTQQMSLLGGPRHGSGKEHVIMITREEAKQSSTFTEGSQLPEMKSTLQKVKVAAGKKEEKSKRNAATTSDMETVSKRIKKEEGNIDEDSRKKMVAGKEYGEFEEKVRRTVFIDNLSPQITSVVIKMALGQFGNVSSVEFIPNFTVPFDIPQCALVEMESETQSRHVIENLSKYPFLVSGMPRPIRVRPSKAEMFADRPLPPDREIAFRWLEQSDQDYDSANKLKELVKKHRGETFALIELLRKEEEKLAQQQSELLQVQYKKYEMIDSLVQDGTLPRLARHYGIKLTLVDD